MKKIFENINNFWPFEQNSDRFIAGYRSVPLKNAFSEDLELSSLLVHLDKRKQVRDCRENLEKPTNQ